MWPSSRKLIAPALVALAGTALLSWLGLATAAFTDYEQEAEPALAALRDGHLQGFLSLLPAYGGSLILRSPFALAPGLWSGGDLAVFRSMAAPCLVAGAALGVRSTCACARKACRGSPRSSRSGSARPTRSPLRALETGHPEELLGAAACVAAVIAASRERSTWAGVLLGLAIARSAELDLRDRAPGGRAGRVGPRGRRVAPAPGRSSRPGPPAARADPADTLPARPLEHRLLRTAVPARAVRLGGSRCAPCAAAHACGHPADVGQLRADTYAGLARRAGGLLPGLERPLAIALCWQVFDPRRCAEAAATARAMMARRLPTLAGAGHAGRS